MCIQPSFNAEHRNVREGIFAEQVEISKNVISLALIRENPGPALSTSGSPFLTETRLAKIQIETFVDPTFTSTNDAKGTILVEP